ncbi:hypothetical protein BAE44_0025752 [Dichanthelium oligosanthes]|uniref:DUF1618 domain-containing protein n=1 Tax=Dichanthelium oligosanthes TaxID=888268 RepID=A0A1E5UK16_9POAL|nr:hypothetical protein BAE44_0025752 [Dichanthelium oligosanthes]
MEQQHAVGGHATGGLPGESSKILWVDLGPSGWLGAHHMEQQEDEHLPGGLAQGIRGTSFQHRNGASHFTGAGGNWTAAWTPRGITRPQQNGETCRTSRCISPLPCVSGEDVVYLVAREKFMHPKAWILAVDMKNVGRLKAAAYFGVRKYRGLDVIYCPSRISKYMNPAKYGNAVTTQYCDMYVLTLLQNK